MTSKRWPKPLAEQAYHGVLGDMVKTIEPETEADSVNVLMHLLVMFGNCIGRTPKLQVGADVHHMNLFAVIVGATAKGRKGMGRSQAQKVWTEVDENWATHCIQSGGLSTGEGLIHKIRDLVEKQHPVKEQGKVTRYESIIEDHGVADKRLLVIEPEFASTLKVMARDGNTLSPILRVAWDGYTLQTLTKASAETATGPRVSFVGHITSDELRRVLAVTETANGFGNRFLWMLSKRSKELPNGGKQVSLDAYVDRLRQAIDTSRRSSVLRRDDAANHLWARIYGRLSSARAGMFGAMTARAEAQVMRVACVYALADASAVVRVPHLEAVLEVWRYAFDSAQWLFGDRMGDHTADAILEYLRGLYPERATRTDISGLFHRHKPASEIDRALGLLREYDARRWSETGLKMGDRSSGGPMRAK
jgi:hypothetical protein